MYMGQSAVCISVYSCIRVNIYDFICLLFCSSTLYNPIILSITDEWTDRMEQTTEGQTKERPRPLAGSASLRTEI